MHRLRSNRLLVLLLGALLCPAGATADRVPPAEIVRLYEAGMQALADGRRLREAGNHAEARARFEAARSQLTDTVRRDPTFLDAVLGLSDVLWALDRHREAIGPLERALRGAPDDARLDRALGLHLLRLGHGKRAAALLERAAARRPGSFDVHYVLAGYYYQQGDLGPALRHAETYLTLRPQDAKVHGLVGNIHLRSNRLADAVRSFQRVLALDPDNLPVRVNLATVFYRL